MRGSNRSKTTLVLLADRRRKGSFVRGSHGSTQGRVTSLNTGWQSVRSQSKETVLDQQTKEATSNRTERGTM
jgi:hypothetical protein